LNVKLLVHHVTSRLLKVKVHNIQLAGLMSENLKVLTQSPHQSCDFWETSLLGCYTVSTGKYQQFRGVQYLQYVYYVLCQSTGHNIP
jgi:hypothetical protein